MPTLRRSRRGRRRRALRQRGRWQIPCRSSSPGLTRRPNGRAAKIGPRCWLNPSIFLSDLIPARW